MNSVLDNPTLEVISDVVCPWCFIGKARLEQALKLLDENLRLNISWQPYQLNPKMPAAGAERLSYYAQKFGSPAAAAQLFDNITANAKEAGLEIHFERIARVPNTLNAHRLIWFTAESGKQVQIVDRLFNAYFVEGRDIGDLETLVDIAVQAEFDRGSVSAFLTSDTAREVVQTAAQAAHDTGIQGVPAFRFNGHYLFSGAQSAETISLSIKRAVKKGL